MCDLSCDTEVKKPECDPQACRARPGEQGIALVIALVAISIFSAIAFYLSFNSNIELRISDNLESRVQARYAALAGINHGRDVIRGLDWDRLLKGPDNAYTNTTEYLNQARAASFRNPLSWAMARGLDIFNPSITGVADDGLMNDGGTVLIPLAGIAITAPNPYGSGNITTARYFVRIADNNGEASELAKDAANNPFIDGDGIVILRSMGISRTIGETAGGTVRANSVVVYEARFSNGNPFANLGSPVVVIGSQINAEFDGNAFDITGGSGGPGIATIDTNTSDPYHPADIIKTATSGKGTITGDCTGADANNCVADITASAMADPNKAKLADPVWLYNFVFNEVPKFADNHWDGLSTVDLGTTSHPKTTFVNGNLSLTGSISGAGLLVVTGDLFLGGEMRWDGLVLVVGTGMLWTHGMNEGVHGGIICANLVKPTSGDPYFGAASTVFDIRGNSQIADFDNGLWSMGDGLVPPKQLSIREVPSNIDP